MSFVLDNPIGIVIAIFTAIGAMSVLAHYHGPWWKKLFSRAWHFATLPVRVTIAYIASKLKQCRANIYIRICRVGVRREREQLALHFMGMLHDSESQRLGSWLVDKDGTTPLDDEKRQRLKEPMIHISTLGMGRSESLKDVISYLMPETYPPENWSGWSAVIGDAVFWREQESHNENMILLERVDKKYGRAHKLFYRKDML